MLVQYGYDFDNVLLVPQPSTVNSRNDVDLSVNLGKGLELKIPIIASPMKGITSVDVIKEMDRLGGIGILHRFYTSHEQRAVDIFELGRNCYHYGVAVGLDDTEEYWAADLGAWIICVDVANGYLDSVKRYCERVANYISSGKFECLLMAGNVVTFDGVADLHSCGVDLVRVGIGSGQLCTTRKVTGVGYPQLSAIEDCSGFNQKYPYGGKTKGIVADGGIRNSGDGVKALAAGADILMLGSLFGRCKESSHNGVIYGMASRKLQEEYYHNTKSVEGVEKEIEKDTTVEDFINEFTWGMKSAFTYMNAKNIKQLQENARWVEV